MNKKLFLGMFAAAGMLFATSCSHEDLIEPVSGETSTVSFVINTEDAVATRAVADGETATKLHYAVWHSSGSIAKQGVEELQNGATTLNLTLAKGQTYTLGFWAQAENAHTVTIEEGGAMTVDINYGLNNAETFDAFTAHKTYTVAGNDIQTVTLKRPFAQINVGVTAENYTAAESAGVKVEKSKVELQGTFGTEFNVISGVVTDSRNGLALAENNIPALAEELTLSNGAVYKYISTSYVLPERIGESQLVDAKFTFKGENGSEIVLDNGVSNLPIQSNYRTNIVGSVLTGNIDFNVVIDPAFEQPEQPAILVWDGVTTTQPQVVDGKYQVSNAAEWAWLANGSSRDVVLTANIDFAGHKVSQIYLYNTATLDGQGHTLSNLVIKQRPSASDYSLGLLQMDGDSPRAIKNLTIKNITVENSNADYGYASALGDVQRNITIENVHVVDSYIKGVQSVGGLVSFVNSDVADLTIKDCSVEGTTLCNYDVQNESGYVAGLVGRHPSANPLSGINFEGTVKSVGNNITGIYATRRGEASIAHVVGGVSNEAIAAAYPSVTFDINNNLTATAQIVADVIIRTVADLQAFADAVNGGDTFAGKTVALANDLDLTGIDWTPIGGHAYNCRFAGAFDGHGYTIKNMTITDTDQHYDSNGNLLTAHATGFFAFLGGSYNSTIKNLNFEKAKVTGTHWVGVVCGYTEFGTIYNCKVNNSEVKSVGIPSGSGYVDGYDGDKAGCITGMIAPNAGSVVVERCVATNSEVKAVRDAGQGVGIAYVEAHADYVKNCSASNVSVSGLTATSTNIREEFVGRTR